mmetsp:Transcript_3187/g.7494  ORF Transcript_3187/g.7494 Transcript_3187/m.7494 type:complete len:105 (-) Transcript_3187:549-863(-)
MNMKGFATNASSMKEVSLSLKSHPLAQVGDRAVTSVEKKVVIVKHLDAVLLKIAAPHHQLDETLVVASESDRTSIAGPKYSLFDRSVPQAAARQFRHLGLGPNS